MQQQKGSTFFYYCIRADEIYEKSVISIDLEKLELFGTEYLFKYAENLLKQQNEDLIYRIYVTDCLKTIAQNTANFNGGNVMKSRYFDIIQPSKNNIPEKSSADILANINRKLAQIRGEENG